PMIEDEGLMNSFGTIFVLSTRSPPPSSMWAWKLPATARSLPGRRIGASSWTESRGWPPPASAALRTSSSMAGPAWSSPSRAPVRPPLTSTIVSLPASPLTAPARGLPSGPRKLARRMGLSSSGWGRRLARRRVDWGCELLEHDLDVAARLRHEQRLDDGHTRRSRFRRAGRLASLVERIDRVLQAGLHARPGPV